MAAINWKDGHIELYLDLLSLQTSSCYNHPDSLRENSHMLLQLKFFFQEQIKDLTLMFSSVNMCSVISNNKPSQHHLHIIFFQ